MTASGSVFLEELNQSSGPQAPVKPAPSASQPEVELSLDHEAPTHQLDVSEIEQSLAERSTERAVSSSDEQEPTPIGPSADALPEPLAQGDEDTDRPQALSPELVEGSSVEDLNSAQVLEERAEPPLSSDLARSQTSRSLLSLNVEQAQLGEHQGLGAAGYPPIFCRYIDQDRSFGERREVILPCQQSRGTSSASHVSALLRGYQALIACQLEAGVPRVVALGHEPQPWVTLSAPQLSRTLSGHQPPKTEKDWQRVIGWIWQLSYLISLTHARGVVHLNLSPQAIGVSSYGLLLSAWEGAQVIGDDGSAEALPIELVYEPTWAAPELLSSDKPLMSPKQADVYGLGALFFWLLTGESIPADEEALEARLSEVWAAPLELTQVISAALSQSIALRPKDGEQVYRALFKSAPLPLKRTLEESSTLELSISDDAKATQLAQLAFNAKVPFEMVPFPVDESVAQPDHYIGLKPRARLKVEGLSGVVGATICSERGPQVPAELSSAQVMEVGVYLVRWSVGARHCEWRLSLSPLADRSLSLSSAQQGGWSLIPSGPSWVGSAQAQVGEVSLHAVELDAYEITERLVSCAEYFQFLQSLSPELAQQRAPLGAWDPALWGSSAPVVGLSPSDALHYVTWRGADLRLPTCAEWEKATRGESTRERLDEQAHHSLSDLSAGLGELCLTQVGSTEVVIKGGRWSFGLIASRQMTKADTKCAEVGFRLVRSL